MSIIYREEKGGPLTALEVDDNFRQLDRRIRAIEQQSVLGKPYRLKLEGQDVVLLDDAGHEVSRTTIPMVGLLPRGVWSEHNAYACRDIVTHEGATYICINAQKPGPFKAEDWQVLLTKEEKHESF